MFRFPSHFYNAVPFVGIINLLISKPSSSNNFILFFIPPPYPVRDPFVATTLWHGIIMQIGFVFWNKSWFFFRKIYI